MSKEEFTDKLKYGDEEWDYLAHNGQDGQPCTYGCIMKQRRKPPYDYHLVGDCRVPWSDDCCMNRQAAEKKRLQRGH